MFGRRRTTDRYADDRDVVVEHGASLAKGPALIAGSILMVFGLAALLKNNDFPSFSAQFPDGTAQGTSFLGIEVNGWTAFFSIVAGALMLFGAAQHHLAKLMSTIVGLALLACAVIALIDGDDVLGLAATNAWTKAAFAIAGGVILLNALMPRRTRTRELGTVAPATARTTAAEPATTVHDREPVADRTVAADRDRPVAADRTAVADREAVADRTTPVADADDDVPAPRRRRRIFGRPGPRENDQPSYAGGPRTQRTAVRDDEPATTVAPGDPDRPL
jgi:Domain of unknown function (DUF4383)